MRVHRAVRAEDGERDDLLLERALLCALALFRKGRGDVRDRRILVLFLFERAVDRGEEPRAHKAAAEEGDVRDRARAPQVVALRKLGRLREARAPQRLDELPIRARRHRVLREEVEAGHRVGLLGIIFLRRFGRFVELADRHHFGQVSPGAPAGRL